MNTLVTPLVPCLVVVGATASGKSSLAIDVALALREQGHPAEIVNADSMCVYRGMDIGTAKPTPAQQALVRHHLIDILDIHDSASVAAFQDMARERIASLRASGIIPIVVGGSSLYNRAITDHFDFPGTDPAVRAKWNEELERRGSHALHALLAERNPAAAEAILPGNGRRIVRALEVIELTGDFQATLPEHTYALDNVHQYGVSISREQMDAQIAERVHQMWHEGFVDEVRSLEANGLREGVTASKALGYQQILAFLAGECTEEEAKEATITGTRKFARKQLMWFKRDPRITWLSPEDPDKARTIARALL